MANHHHAPGPESSPISPERRRFLAVASVAIQAALGAAIAAPWIGAFGYPLWAKASRKVTGFIPVGPLERFELGRPSKVAIAGDGGDAWTRHKDMSLGAAWVIRQSEEQFAVFSTTCPHLGCAINHDASHNRFLCPCHGSHFQLTGSRIEQASEPNPSPRDMDPLLWKVEAGQLWVKYERFRTGTAERISA